MYQKSRAAESLGEEMMGDGWVDNWEGGCHEKGRRGVGRIEVSETTELFKNEPNFVFLELFLYKNLVI